MNPKCINDQEETQVNQEIAVRQPLPAVGTQPRPSVPMISPDIVRPRLPEVGRIRLGEKKGEKGYPAKLDAFRFTSRDQALMEIVAGCFGGKVIAWQSDEGPQWQVYSEATSLEVVVPKAELAFSQWFENWDGAVCRRRCDGHREIVGDQPCICDPDKRVCLPTTRLNVMLPDIPGMGVWRVESHGFNAAAEILGTIELAAASGATLLPATLMLAQRSKRRPDPKNPAKTVTNRFVVPVLVINASLREMVAEQAAIRRRALGLPPMVELADEGRMRALRTEVFTRWPRSVDDEAERSKRLAQLSEMLGRPVLTISQDHNLTMQEAILLTDTVASLPDELPVGETPQTAEPSPKPATVVAKEEPAAPSSAAKRTSRTPPSAEKPAAGPITPDHVRGLLWNVREIARLAGDPLTDEAAYAEIGKAVGVEGLNAWGLDHWTAAQAEAAGKELNRNLSDLRKAQETEGKP